MPEEKARGLSKGPAIPVDRGKKYRVILTGDIACEVNYLYAAAYALMSEKLDVVGNDVPTGGWEFNLGNDCHATNI